MTKKTKLTTIDKQQLDNTKTLPFNGNAVTAKSFSFSFACFDRTHSLFNLGDNTEDGVVNGKWFLDLMDCLRSVSNMTIADLKASLHDLHPVDWSNANANIPANSGQCEYWQFRINKSRGRVIGFLIDNVFYIVWLDPHHNLTDSEGYGGVNKYKSATSIYETQERKIKELEERIERCQEDLVTAEELLDEKANQ